MSYNALLKGILPNTKASTNTRTHSGLGLILSVCINRHSTFYICHSLFFYNGQPTLERNGLTMAEGRDMGNDGEWRKIMVIDPIDRINGSVRIVVGCSVAQVFLAEFLAGDIHTIAVHVIIALNVSTLRLLVNRGGGESFVTDAYLRSQHTEQHR